MLDIVQHLWVRSHHTPEYKSSLFVTPIFVIKDNSN